VVTKIKVSTVIIGRNKKSSINRTFRWIW